ncbi:MAG: hypothetical protein ACO2OZ_10910 [Acidilobaceae archaeon]
MVLDLVLQLFVGLVLLTIIAIAITAIIYYRVTTSNICREEAGFED